MVNIHRNPNVPGPVPTYWPAYTEEGEEYLQITRELTPDSVKKYLIANRYNLWSKLIPDSLPTRQICKAESKGKKQKSDGHLKPHKRERKKTDGHLVPRKHFYKYIPLLWLLTYMQ